MSLLEQNSIYSQLEYLPKHPKWSGRFFTKDDDGRWHSHRYVRFTTPDPLALSYPSLSPPYAYCANNPVNNVDLDKCLITVLP